MHGQMMRVIRLYVSGRHMVELGTFARVRDDAVEELHFCLLFAFYSFTVEWDEKKSPQNCYGNPNHRSDGVIVRMDEDQSGLGEGLHERRRRERHLSRRRRDASLLRCR